MGAVTLALAVIAVGLIFATTRRGREIAKRIGFRDHVAGAASREDVAFLLRACGDDGAELERRLAAERAQVPELSESEHYRRAIRKVMAEKGKSV